jgi:CorA-like Mg2+ transporter protein
MRVRRVTDTGPSEVPAASDPDVLNSGDGLTWIDLDHADEQGMALLPHDFRPTSSIELIIAIRREMMGTLEYLIGSAAARIATFERQIIESDPVKSEKLLEQLFELRHHLQTIRTDAAQAHQSYSNLLETASLQEGLLKVDVRRVSELRQGFGHIMNPIDMEREYLQEMLDLFQTRVSAELNRFVRKVTAWGSVGLAWTVIVGLYGMNFTHMPELSWIWGYPAVLAVMALVGVILVVFFRRHGWLRPDASSRIVRLERGARTWTATPPEPLRRTGPALPDRDAGGLHTDFAAHQVSGRLFRTASITFTMALRIARA